MLSQLPSIGHVLITNIDQVDFIACGNLLLLEIGNHFSQAVYPMLSLCLIICPQQHHTAGELNHEGARVVSWYHNVRTIISI